MITLGSACSFSGAAASWMLRLAEGRFGVCCLKAISEDCNEDVLAGVAQKDPGARRTGVPCSGELGRFFSDLYKEAVRFLHSTIVLLIFWALPCDTEAVLSSVSCWLRIVSSSLLQRRSANKLFMGSVSPHCSLKSREKLNSQLQGQYFSHLSWPSPPQKSSEVSVDDLDQQSLVQDTKYLEHKFL